MPQRKESTAAFLFDRVLLLDQVFLLLKLQFKNGLASVWAWPWLWL